MNYVLLAAGVLGLGVGAFFIARSPHFWIELVKEALAGFLPAILKILKNRPKTDKEWAEWRDLSTRKPSDLSAKEADRLKELKRLNKEWRSKN